MDKTLELFKVFHYLKEITTKSYSLKKLQDLIEARIDKNTMVGEGEYDEFVKELNEISDKLVKSIKDIEEIV
jgi:hypothetical protein